MTAGPAPLRADRLLGASLWRITFLLVQGGGSVILAAVLGQILDAQSFATTSVAQGIVVLAQAIGDFGVSQAAVTILPARIASTPAATERLLAGAARACVYACAAAFGLALLSALLVPNAALVPILVSAPAAAATVAVAGADGLLRAQGEYRRPVALVASSEICGFIGIPVALATHAPDWTCAAISAGTTLGAFGAVVVLRRHRGTDHTRARRTTSAFVRAAVPLGLAQILVVLSARIDTLLMASVNGVVAAGTFEGDWRIYQLGQYAAGALATAAAPFVASALGTHDLPCAIALVRRLLLRLLGVGMGAGALLYFARWPLASLLAGSLATPVAHGLVFLAAASPAAAVGVPAFYTLIALDGERQPVLGCFAAGAVINLGLGVAFAGSLGVTSVLIGSAAGATATSLLLLARLAVVSWRLARSGEPQT